MNSKRYSYLYSKAVHLAKKSDMQHRHACIILKNNEIVAEGFNKQYNLFEHLYSIHAEMDAINKLPCRSNKFISQCEMFVFRIGSDHSGNPTKLSKPCKVCQACIQKLNFKKVYYSVDSCQFCVQDAQTHTSLT